MKTKKCDALWISDVHLGSRGSRAEELLKVLKSHEPERLYIVGDFIDGWLLKKRHWWPQSHTNVLRKILSYSKEGVRVYIVSGNHDSFLREYGLLEFGNIVISDHFCHDGVLVIHGDQFDAIVMNQQWLAKLGGWAYEFVIRFDRRLARVRSVAGLKPRSLSKWIKKSVKGAYLYIDRFERVVTREARRKGCHTVVCGHIHTAGSRHHNGIHYLNTGDWVESMSYIVQTGEKYEIKYYEG